MLITVMLPYIDILTPLTDEHLRLLELAGRVCYKSEERISPASATKFIKMIRDSNHESVLEHVSATVRIVGSRSMSHQLVRHRIASYCLAGETEVIAFASGQRRGPKRWTLAQLYAWSQDARRKGRLKRIRLRSLDTDGRLVPGCIKSIVYSGGQPVFKVTTKFGRQIEATTKHRFLTPNGWKQLSELHPGDELLSNGIPAYKNREWVEHQYLTLNKPRKEVARLANISDACMGKWISRLGLQKPKSKYPNRQSGHGVSGMFSPDAIEKMSAAKQGEKNPAWKGEAASISAGRYRAQHMFELPTSCECCGFEGRIVRHHVDGDTHNNSADNIMFLCECCHKQWHIGSAVMSVFRDKIVSIEPTGTKDTYDIEMAGQNHNFVANGLVVHNSQESQRYVNYGKKGFQVICPPRIGLPVGPYHYDPNDPSIFYFDSKLSDPYPITWFNDLSYMWLVGRARDYLEYQHYLDAKVPPEDARECLPNATKTEVVATYNLRTWRHVFEERALNKHAQWQIRGLMQDVLIEFGKALPAVFGDQLLRINAE